MTTNTDARRQPLNKDDIDGLLAATARKQQIEAALLVGFRKAYRAGEASGFWSGMIMGSIIGVLSMMALASLFGAP